MARPDHKIVPGPGEEQIVDESELRSAPEIWPLERWAEVLESSIRSGSLVAGVLRDHVLQRLDGA
eukprot:13761547-Alexandrium_andersonii.AAC.1